MVDKRNSEILVRSEVGVSLRDGHSDGVPGIGSCAGEVGEEPPIDVMDLRGPHIAGTPARPLASREDVALQSEWSTVEVRESLRDYNILALYISNADAIKKQQKARNAPSLGGFGCLELCLYYIRELA